MTAEVKKFYPRDAANNPDNVLEQAIGQYKEVLILGWDPEGRLDVRSTTGIATGHEMLWLLERVKFNLMAGVYDVVSEDDDGCD